MATKVLTRAEADKLGLIPKKLKDRRPKRLNVHVEEIVKQVKGTKAGQFVLYEPGDKKSYQTQVLRIRQAFNLLRKVWPKIQPLKGGASAATRILSRKESFEEYPQQPLAPKASIPKPKPPKKPGRKRAK